MMTNHLTQAHLEWLELQVRPERGYKGKEYWELLEILRLKEFVWIVANDDNRCEDAVDIRIEFFHTFELVPLRPGSHPGPHSSVLEVIVGLSRRLEFVAGGSANNWAWELITNLELHKMSGHLGRIRKDRIETILETLIWRTYAADGQGGFFPLAWPKEDQRQVEIWYQMSAYVDEVYEP